MEEKNAFLYIKYFLQFLRFKGSFWILDTGLWILDNNSAYSISIKHPVSAKGMPSAQYQAHLNQFSSNIQPLRLPYSDRSLHKNGGRGHWHSSTLHSVVLRILYQCSLLRRHSLLI